MHVSSNIKALVVYIKEGAYPLPGPPPLCASGIDAVSTLPLTSDLNLLLMYIDP
jgi:hypothetical protein